MIYSFGREKYVHLLLGLTVLLSSARSSASPIDVTHIEEHR